MRAPGAELLRGSTGTHTERSDSRKSWLSYLGSTIGLGGLARSIVEEESGPEENRNVA